MRCLTCGNSKHPGYVAWHDAGHRGSVPRPALIPCPDCAGSVIVSGCEGSGEDAGDPPPRPYRYYLLDDRGMIFLAEIADRESDDEAKRHAAELLKAHGTSTAVEVWDVRRSVDVARRTPQPGP